MNGLLLVLVGDPKGSSLASTASSFQKIKIFQSYLLIENVLLLNLATFDLSIFFLLYRDALQKFFYPFDYQEIQVTKPLVPGQRRVHTGLDVKFDFECDSTLDILFSKNRVSLH